MGCSDLTDGVWVWPEGLVHYIEAHELVLPEEFLATMEQNQWRVPEVDNIDEIIENGYDISWWKDWYENRTSK